VEGNRSLKEAEMASAFKACPDMPNRKGGGKKFYVTGRKSRIRKMLYTGRGKT